MHKAVSPLCGFSFPLIHLFLQDPGDASTARCSWPVPLGQELCLSSSSCPFFRAEGFCELQSPAVAQLCCLAMSCHSSVVPALSPGSTDHSGGLFKMRMILLVCPCWSGGSLGVKVIPNPAWLGLGRVLAASASLNPCSGALLPPQPLSNGFSSWLAATALDPGSSYKGWR